MLPEQRKQWILDYLTDHSFADVSSLVEALQVSPATVRRDLQELADRGAVVRTRGGAALATKGVGHEPTIYTRSQVNVSEKRAIARVARDFVHEGEVIGLDVGTSTLELAKLLRDHKNITVFTTSLLIADVLAKSEVNVVLVGGTLRKREMCVTGAIAV